jgi:hypothetical protein
VEFGWSLLLATAFSVWSERWNGKAIIDATLDGNRSAVYAALATISGSLLGFVITAASIVLGFSASEKLAIVRESKHYPTLWQVFIAAIRALAFSTIVCIVALVLDRDKQIIHGVMYVAAFGCILAAARVARCVWVLENIIKLVAQPSKRTAQPPSVG